MSQIQIISIEGNIGSGKSTLLYNLKKTFTNLNDDVQFIFLKEPVDEWSKITDENGVTILEKFYADQPKYSFSFQIMAYISRLKLLRDCVSKIKSDIEENSNKHYIIITERSLYTDKMVFAKMLYDSGNIEHVNYQIYLNWFDTFAKEFSINKIIYVKTCPQICHQRIEKRHRNGENSIPIDYLKLCDDYHDKMLDKTSIDCFCLDQLILNGDEDIYSNENILNEWIESIKKFLCI